MTIHNLPSASFIAHKLVELFNRDKWRTRRRHPLGLTFNEHCSTYPMTALYIIQHCPSVHEELSSVSREIGLDLKDFSKHGLTYYWQLKNGQPTFFQSALLGKLLKMSPDADDSCLRQLVDPQPQFHNDLVRKLSECRVGTRQYVYTPAQKRKIPEADGSFMTWLPSCPAEGKSQLETIDLGVDGVILSFLKNVNRYDISGVIETEHVIRSVLHGDLILRDPFVVSPYYPYPATILYLLARAIKWGKLEDLYSSLERISTLARSIQPRNAMDILCLTSVGLLLDDSILNEHIQELDVSKEMQITPYFIGHFGLGTKSYTFNMARLPVMQFSHSNEAVQWAMLLWIMENLQ